MKRKFSNGIHVSVVFLTSAFLLFLFAQSKYRTWLIQYGSSSSVNAAEPQIFVGSACLGEEIAVSYPLSNNQTDSPFECLNYCSTRATRPHFILYSNGYATQCGIRSCQDWAEDKCVTCHTPQNILSKYGLIEPSIPAPCNSTSKK